MRSIIEGREVVATITLDAAGDPVAEHHTFGGRRISAVDPARKGLPVVPFTAPAGIRMVRIDRRSGRRVFGAWPGDDPKAAVIWEAFKPESEPRRTIRREEIEERAKQKTNREDLRIERARDSDFLQREGGIY